MKISLCSILFREHFPENIISKIAELGYEGIKICGKDIQDYLAVVEVAEHEVDHWAG